MTQKEYDNAVVFTSFYDKSCNHSRAILHSCPKFNYIFVGHHKIFVSRNPSARTRVLDMPVTN